MNYERDFVFAIVKEAGADITDMTKLPERRNFVRVKTYLHDYDKTA